MMEYRFVTVIEASEKINEMMNNMAKDSWRVHSFFRVLALTEKTEWRASIVGGGTEKTAIYTSILYEREKR